MATGANNSSGERLGLFQRAMVPLSGSAVEGCVLVHANATDNLIVDAPNSASALLGGRAFAGINASAGTVNPAIDNQVTVQKGGIAKARLKASTACIAGQECGYAPADGGTVQPVTPANAGALVSIGRFTQSKASSANVQMVGVELYAPTEGGGERMLGAIVASSSFITNTASETAFDLSVPIPAGRVVSVGTVLKIRAKARVTGGNGSNTLQMRCRLDTTAGVLLGQTPAVDVTDLGGDLAVLDLVATVRAVGASGTLVADGFGGISPGQLVTTGGNVQATGTAGTVAVDWTVAHTIIITALWNAASPSNAVLLEDLVVTILG